MRQRSTGVDAEVSLAWLLEPLSVETFLDEIWGKDHHHIKRGRPATSMLSCLDPRRSTGFWSCFATSRQRCGWYGEKTRRVPTATGWPMAALDVVERPQ